LRTSPWKRIVAWPPAPTSAVRNPRRNAQKLLGHASPHMTLRYMKHAPENYFAEDAARVATSLSGERNREAGAQAQLAWELMRRA